MQDDPIESPQPIPGAPPPVTPAPASLLSQDIAPGVSEPDATTDSPAWADDLRKLYNAVVEEPLPDSLIDLLSQLDAED